MSLFDQALDVAADDEMRELIAIGKADALISLQRNGEEVDALPAIVMRHRNPRHTYLAAYALQYKHHIEGNLKRSIFYGRVALDAATEVGNREWQGVTYLELGNALGEDSQIDEAATCFERVLHEFTEVQGRGRAGAMESLGYCRVLQGHVEEGVALMTNALAVYTHDFDRAETYIDLTYAHLELGELDRALVCGRQGLALAQEPRQIRNAHYLLGEVAYRLGDIEAAEHHFDELQSFYPGFANLKSVLYALDLRKLVNFKLP